MVGFDIFDSLFSVTSNIEGVSRCLRDGQSEVQSDTAWHSAESDDNSPSLVHRILTDAGTVLVTLRSLERVFESSDSDQGDHSSSELTDTLHGED